jgi:phosphoglycolate phosphatase-like HAD superfamily hydrolase
VLTVFDLDGTLIDNEEAVRYAYLRAGVAMPSDAWGKPAGNWCTEEQHEIKQAFYMNSLMEYGKEGPALLAWNVCLGPKAIITGASLRSAQDSLDFIEIPHTCLALCGASIKEKIAWIKGAMTSQEVLYIDMDRAISKEIQKETLCKIAFA